MDGMLEVVNGPLMVYLTILSLVGSLSFLLVLPIHKIFFKKSSEEQLLFAEILELKAKQKSISIKDEFAAHSKLQRKINQLEINLTNLIEDRESKERSFKRSLKLSMDAALWLLLFGSSLWFRSKPLVVFKMELLPFQTTLGYPTSVNNAISAHMWVIMTNVTLRQLLKPLNM